MNAKIDNNMLYNGSVQLSIKIGNKIIKKDFHNNGTMLLKKLFAMFMCGGKSAESALEQLPKRLDLRFIQSDVEYSNLRKPVYVTSPTYGLDNTLTESSWYVEYNAVIPYESLVDPIKQDFQYKFYLMGNIGGTDLAYIDVSYEDLAGLEPGVSIIIAWRLKLLVNQVVRGGNN